ncbi:MAG TPA: diaminopimelate decarboxylase [Phycisphaerales bacterium]|nr:diaminopimelate decarboxylase [Phycisphaerales bacterium]
MDDFHYRDGELYCEGVRVSEVAAEVGTPVYIYSRGTLVQHAAKVRAAFADLDPLVCFAVKSCPNIHILSALAEAGCGMDVVSGGELRRARLAGVGPSRIVFAGVGKTDNEIRDALRGGAPAGEDAAEPIGLFNVESEPEYEVLAMAARAMGVRAKAALRVNPGVKAGGHAYVETATQASKFGVDLDHAAQLLERFSHEKHLRLSGVHLHIGSSIVTPEPYAEALARVLAVIDGLARKGVTVDTLDIGGGFGADYQTGDAPSAAEFARVIVPMLKDHVARGLRIVIEPGRSISANAGVLLTRVLFVKLAGGGAKKFVVCDAGMNTLIRPALYNAFHFIWPTSVSPQHEPVRRAAAMDLPGLETCDVVGPVCESGDFFAKDRLMPMVARGDLLAVFAAGAYGMSMASRYNSHPLPAEVLVTGTHAKVIRRRETLGDLTEHELVLGG